jgi:hypothetical protein
VVNAFKKVAIAVRKQCCATPGRVNVIVGAALVGDFTQLLEIVYVAGFSCSGNADNGHDFNFFLLQVGNL